MVPFGLTLSIGEDLVRLLVFCVAVGATLLSAQSGMAEISDGVIKIGVLDDMSGGYEDVAGAGSVEAARIAIEEFGGAIDGKAIELVSADHRNKPDVGGSIVAQWFDVDHVDVVADVVTSSVAFAVQELARARKKAVLFSSAGSADLTGRACAPYSVQWTYDTYEVGNGIAEAVPQLGKTWYFVTADYSFGHDLETGVTNAILKRGAKVLGGVAPPLGAQDFSSFMLQAQASKAEVIVLANGGDDTINAVKTAKEFGIVGSQKIVPLGFTSLSAIRAVTLDIAQGMYYVTPWFAGRDEESRAFGAKFLARVKKAPSPFQAGVYSSIRTYLQAIKDTHSDAAEIVVPKMRETPINDAFAKGGVLRPDGRMVHDVYLVQIKSPAESKGDWDYLKLIAAIPGDKVFRPMAEGGCPHLAK
jgi:branched-chain amino acid transport system substrate-binding protein